MNRTLSDSANSVIHRFSHLNLGGKEVVTPYFMNERGKKGRRVYVGKGHPAEIESLTKSLAEKYDFNLDKASSEEIRDFMISHEVGIDCSGFVVWVLNEIAQEKSGVPIWKLIDLRMPSILGKFKGILRPVENISVRVLTHPDNSAHILNLNDIQPGDYIRTLGGHHILLISEVYYEDNIPKEFTYINSTMYKDKYYGIRKGRVLITNPDKYLIHQDWIDDGENGINWVFDAVKNHEEDSKIMRLKALYNL
jgi:hypothetical protein